MTIAQTGSDVELTVPLDNCILAFVLEGSSIRLPTTTECMKIGPTGAMITITHDPFVLDLGAVDERMALTGSSATKASATNEMGTTTCFTQLGWVLTRQ